MTDAKRPEKIKEILPKHKFGLREFDKIVGANIMHDQYTAYVESLLRELREVYEKYYVNINASETARWTDGMEYEHNMYKAIKTTLEKWDKGE